jgi:hypothetical protein
MQKSDKYVVVYSPVKMWGDRLNEFNGILTAEQNRLSKY